MVVVVAPHHQLLRLSQCRRQRMAAPPSAALHCWLPAAAAASLWLRRRARSWQPVVAFSAPAAVVLPAERVAGTTRVAARVAAAVLAWRPVPHCCHRRPRHRRHHRCPAAVVAAAAAVAVFRKRPPLSIWPTWRTTTSMTKSSTRTSTCCCSCASSACTLARRADCDGDCDACPIPVTWTCRSECRSLWWDVYFTCIRDG